MADIMANTIYYLSILRDDEDSQHGIKHDMLWHMRPNGENIYAWSLPPKARCLSALELRRRAFVPSSNDASWATDSCPSAGYQ